MVFRPTEPVSRTTLARAGAVALVAVTATSLAACGSSKAGSSAGGGGSTKQVSIALPADAAPSGYDPLLYQGGQYQFMSALYDSLFVTQQDGSVKPSLVTNATPNADKTQWTLTLKQGVTFTDGGTLTADLVKQNLDRRTDSTLVSYGPFAKGGSSEITDVSVKDPQNVVVTFAKPQAAADTLLADEAGVIVGSKGVGSASSLKTTPDGSGPYTLNSGSTTKPSKYTLDKNAKYWNSGVTYPYATVVYKTITDPQAQANALVSGQVEVAAQLQGSTVDFVKSKCSLVKDGGTIVGYGVFDKLGKTSPAFAKTEVRQALIYAIDRKTIVDTIDKGDQATANFFPAAAEGYDPALNDQFAYNPDKAKQLLAAAGYPNGFSFTNVVLGQPNADQVAVQKQWQAIGVRMNFQVANSTDALFAAVNTTPIGYNQFALGNPFGFVAGVLYGGFLNLQHATDPAIEAAIGKAAGATGDARTAALKQLNDAIIQDGWFIPIYEAYQYDGFNKSKVKAPEFAGTSGQFILSSIQPA